MMNPQLLHAQTNEAKKLVVFARDMKALTPEQRKRHSDVLSPALRSSKLKTDELSDGYDSNFPPTQRRIRWSRSGLEVNGFAAHSSTSLAESAIAQPQ